LEAHHDITSQKKSLAKGKLFYRPGATGTAGASEHPYQFKPFSPGPRSKKNYHVVMGGNMALFSVPYHHVGRK